MGACATQTSNNHDPNESFRVIRQGNLTFHISGKKNLDSSTSGQGLKQTSSWFTDLTENELNQKIQEFWDTRIDGSQKAWTTLHSVCSEPSQSKCKEMLKKAGLSLVHGTLSQVLDERGHRYDLPVFIINKPLKFGMPQEEKKVEIEQDSEFFVLMRMAGKQDWKTLVRGSMMVKDLKIKFKNEFNIEKELRMFFKGKEMKDSSCLASLGVQNGFVLIVF
jgi:hypothetical protein